MGKETVKDQEFEMTDELKKLQIEQIRLQNETLKEDIENRKLVKKENRARLEDTGRQLKDMDRQDYMKQSRCNHQKGGEGIDGLNGNGTDSDYAIHKFRWMDGKLHVRCLRCQKLWKPVRLDQYCKLDEIGNPIEPLATQRSYEHPLAPYANLGDAKAAFQTADAEYRKAVAFPTKNKPSGWYVWQFHDQKNWNETMDAIKR